MNEVVHEEPYRLIRVVGSGGMGVVHEAWDTRLDRRVAVKMLHAHLLSDPVVTKRFTREAQLAARLEHPNIVRVYRVVTVNGQLAIEMQYVDGTPLHVLLRSGPLSPEQGADILRQVLDALAACHDQGVVHCDIKPANLLVTRDGHVVLTDFGISRALHGSGSDGGFSGPLWGTPQYSPPEAWEGAPITPQWDLYAVGVLIYEAVTGKPPYEAETPMGLMQAVQRGDAPALTAACPGASETFSNVVASLMARKPEDRLQNARDALKQLRGGPEAGDDMRITAPMPAPGAPQRRGKARRRAGRVLVGTAVALLVVLAGFVINANKRTSREPATAAPPMSEPEAGTPASAPASPNRDPGPIVEADGMFYFAADVPRFGRELWWLDAVVGEAHLVADIFPGAESSNPQFLRRRPQGGFVFAATTPECGAELWFGTSLGEGSQSVRLIKDIIPGPMGSQPEVVAVHDTQLLFYATTIAQGRELWCSNGYEAQTAIVSDLLPGKVDSMPMSARVFPIGERVLFLGYSDGSRGIILFEYSFDSNTIREVADVAEDAGWVTLCGDQALMVNADDDHGYELWLYDGGSSRFEVLADLLPGRESSSPSQLFSWGDRVLFQAKTPDHGRELWMTDGTAGGTRMVADINPGPGDSDPYGFVPVGDVLAFRAKDDAAGRELWVTDGTAEGTVRVADVYPGAESSEPYNLAPVREFLVFTAKDPVHGEELRIATRVEEQWHVQLAADLAPGASSSEPHDLTWIDNRGYFVATFQENGSDLYRIEIADRVLIYPVPYRARGLQNGPNPVSPIHTEFLTAALASVASKGGTPP